MTEAQFIGGYEHDVSTFSTFVFILSTTGSVFLIQLISERA